MSLFTSGLSFAQLDFNEFAKLGVLEASVFSPLDSAAG
jgi:hypothetical protein